MTVDSLPHCPSEEQLPEPDLDLPPAPLDDAFHFNHHRFQIPFSKAFQVLELI